MTIIISIIITITTIIRWRCSTANSSKVIRCSRCWWTWRRWAAASVEIKFLLDICRCCYCLNSVFVQLFVFKDVVVISLVDVIHPKISTILSTYHATIYLPYYLSTILSLYHTIYLPYYLSTILSICHTIYLPYYLSTILSIYHTIYLPYYLSTILSIYHTIYEQKDFEATPLMCQPLLLSALSTCDAKVLRVLVSW